MAEGDYFVNGIKVRADGAVYTTANVAGLDDVSDAAKGDALVGFKQSNAAGHLPDAVARTVHEKLQEIMSVKDFGAVGDGVTDDTTVLQAAVNRMALTGGSLFFPDGTYLISAALTIPASAGWTFLGQSRLGTILKQATDNTPIFRFTSDLTHSWSVLDMKFDWTNVQSSTNTAACPFYFVGTAGTAYNFYNWIAENLNFNNCCSCFGGDTATRFNVWGYTIRDITVQGTVSRSFTHWVPSVVAGNPNGKFDHIYILATTMVGPIFDQRAHHACQMDNIEINTASLGPQIINDTSGATYFIGSLRMEGGTYASMANALFLLSNGYLIADNIDLATLTIDASVGSNPYVFSFQSGVDATSYAKVRQFKFSGSTISAGTMYVFNGSAPAGRLEIDFIEDNALPTGCVLTNNGSTTSAEVAWVNHWANGHIASDKGDADYTFSLGDPAIVRYGTTLSAARTVTLPAIAGSVNLFNGMSVTVIRDALGDFKLDVVRAAPTFLDSFPPNSTGEIEFVWYRTAWTVKRRVIRPAVYTTAVGNVGPGEDNLITFALPANFLAAVGQGVRVTAWGTVANNSNTKEVKLYFGAAILTTALTVSQVGTWRITAHVLKTGSSAQDYSAQLVQGGATTLVDVEGGSLTQTDTAAITIKCTGAVVDGGGGVNNDDIVQEGMIVEFIK